AGAGYSNPISGDVIASQTSRTAVEAAGVVDTSWNSCVDEALEVGDIWKIIFSPVRCALRWAFLPRTAVMTATTVDLGNGWNGTLIAAGADVVAAWSPQIDAEGCRVPVELMDVEF